MTHAKCAWTALMPFVLTFMVNGGPDEPVRAGTLTLAAVLAVATYSCMSFFIAPQSIGAGQML